MSSVTPHVRKHLSADALFHVVRSGFADIPDPRGADVDIALTDTLMSGFQALLEVNVRLAATYYLSMSCNGL